MSTPNSFCWGAVFLYMALSIILLLFIARVTSQESTIYGRPLLRPLAEVAQSDIYVGIIAFRLGSVESNTGKSDTQLEYEKALELGKEIFVYLADEKDSKISPVFFDKGKKQDQLDSLKSILRERHTIDTFINEDDLAEKLKRKFREVLKTISLRIGSPQSRNELIIIEKEFLERAIDQLEESPTSGGLRELVNRYGIPLTREIVIAAYGRKGNIRDTARLFGVSGGSFKMWCHSHGIRIGKIAVLIDKNG